jgi:hypothetical protein
MTLPASAPCPECMAFPHAKGCRWVGAGLVRCGPWVLCAECCMGVGAHRRGCSHEGRPRAKPAMPADAAPLAEQACMRCGLPLDGASQQHGQRTHAPDTCARLLRAAGFLPHVPIEAK